MSNKATASILKKNFDKIKIKLNTSLKNNEAVNSGLLLKKGLIGLMLFYVIVKT